MRVPSRSRNTARRSGWFGGLMPGSLEDAANDVGGRMSFEERQELDASAVGVNTRPFRAGLAQRRRVVAAHAVDVRLQAGEHGIRSRLVENDDGIDTLEGCQHFRPLGGGNDRSSGAFEFSHLVVTVDGNDEKVAMFPRGLE